MKKSRARNRSHRTSTPSVICLPPPKPPVTAPRKEPEVERALSLPNRIEPLVIDTMEGMEVDDHATRQMRRRARRAEARAGRSRRPVKQPAVAEIVREEPMLSVQALVEVPIEAPTLAPIELSAAAPVETAFQSVAEAPSPLPTNRALIRRPARLLERLFGGWLLRRPAQVAHRDPDALTEQMLVLRTELALVQSRLDKIIAATGAG